MLLICLRITQDICRPSHFPLRMVGAAVLLPLLHCCFVCFAVHENRTAVWPLLLLLPLPSSLLLQVLLLLPHFSAARSVVWKRCEFWQ